jgi:hypothetical protein
MCLFMAFDSPYCIVTSSLLCELSHTLPSYAYLKCEIALVLTWSRSMYYNCSILYLASCAAWFVRRLWSAPVILYLLLVRLDLFAALCHNALVTTHVCSVMVFVTSVVVTFSWLVSIPVLRWVAVVVHILLVVDGQWVELVIRLDFKGSIVFFIKKPCAFSCYPLESKNWSLPFVWLGLRGSLWFALVWGGVGALACILYSFLLSCILFILT